MSRLKLHHLHYFWAVAKEGHMTRTASRLHVEPPLLKEMLRRDKDEVLGTYGPT